MRCIHYNEIASIESARERNQAKHNRPRITQGGESSVEPKSPKRTQCDRKDPTATGQYQDHADVR